MRSHGLTGGIALAYAIANAAAVSGETPRAGAAYIALGDWGGHTDKQPTTKWQLMTAEGMNKVAKELGVEAVISLGDHFYHDGVNSNRSARFRTTFEEVYGVQDYLSNLKFHMVAGNHDYYGSIQAQMAYKSSRWSYPSYYYAVKKSWTRRDGGTATADIIFIDTILLLPKYNPSKSKLHLPRSRPSEKQQWEWLQEQLEGSTADFLLVVGHYPIYATGNEGSMPQLVKQLLPLLKKHGAHYLCGHDHSMGHYEEDGVHMFLSGTGRECCKEALRVQTVPQEAIRFYLSGPNGTVGAGPRLHSDGVVGGFLSLQLFDDFAQFIFHDHAGRKLYEPAAVPKREKARAITNAVAVPGETQRAGAAYLALGDWGGHSDEQPTTNGQLLTAEGMNKVARELGVEAVISLGDNIYKWGVNRSDSPRFRTTFEEVYGVKDYLSNLTFHMIAGNHDYYGDVRAQMAYKSRRWSYPSYYYTVKKTWTRRDGGTASADIIFIDTMLFVPQYNPAVWPMHFPDSRPSAQQQWVWLQQQLEGSTADFLLVVGHYPIYATGNEGSMPELIKTLLPLLKKHGAHYMYGHDHTLGHYEEGGVHMFLSGAGHELRQLSHVKTVPKQAIRFYLGGSGGKQGFGPRLHRQPVLGGFLAIQLFDDFAQFSFYDHAGRKLYQPAPVPKRDKKRSKPDDSATAPTSDMGSTTHQASSTPLAEDRGLVGKAGLAFLALGDWGGWDNEHPTSNSQLVTAKGMGKVAEEIGANGVLLLGDNFYHDGVVSNASSRFKSTWADVYLTQNCLAGIPYYVVLGNHDYYEGNPIAQLSYKGHSEWYFPSLFYTLKKSWLRRDGGFATVDFIFIDTVQLVPETNYKWVWQHRKTGVLAENALDMEKYWDWLMQQIDASTSDYLFVVGHYPIYSVGNEGCTDKLVKRLLPKLKSHGGHYISGHDHILGHWEDGGVHMFVSGVGRECCIARSHHAPKGTDRWFITGKDGKGASFGKRLRGGPITGGFLAIELFDDLVRFTIYDEYGAPLYKPDPVPKRDKVKRQLQEDIVI